MGNEECDMVRGVSITNLIAWLSVCLLAAAWGATIDPSWQPIWMRLGAFGLASALGLSATSKFRERRKLQDAQTKVETTLNKRVEALVKREDCFGPLSYLSPVQREPR